MTQRMWSDITEGKPIACDRCGTQAPCAGFVAKYAFCRACFDLALKPGFTWGPTIARSRLREWLDRKAPWAPVAEPPIAGWRAFEPATCRIVRVDGGWVAVTESDGDVAGVAMAGPESTNGVETTQ